MGITMEIHAKSDKIPLQAAVAVATAESAVCLID
jgi:hypothetical protein